MRLRAIILAGGYAKRMWPLTLATPKPLLPLSGKPAIDHIMAKLRELNLSEVVVSTNLRYKGQFEEWLEQSNLSNVRIVAEETMSEEGKLGAVGALMELTEIVAEDDYLIVAGDNLFTAGLSGMVAFYYKIGKPVVAVYKAGDIQQILSGSVVALAEDMRILKFEEKPKKPESDMLGASIYIFPYQTLLRTRVYIGQGGNRDEPGNFLAWLCNHEAVYGYEPGGILWDIGSKEEYERAQLEFPASKAKSQSPTRSASIL